MNEKDKLFKKSRRTKEGSNISTYKSKRNEVNVAVREAKSVYHKKLLEENSRDPNKFWRTLKSIYPTTAKCQTNSANYVVGGVKLNELMEVANAFCSLFTSVVLTIKEKVILLCNFTWR